MQEKQYLQLSDEGTAIMQHVQKLSDEIASINTLLIRIMSDNSEEIDDDDGDMTIETPIKQMVINDRDTEYIMMDVA